MGLRSAIDTADVQIRRATRSDLVAIYRLEKQVFDDPWSYSVFEGFLGESAFLIAAVDDELLGYVVADWIPNFGNNLGHIKDLAVHPDARQNGVGRLLLRHAVSKLVVQGVTWIKLEVRAGNTAAQGLYSDEGFETLRQMPRYYSDGEDALIMVYDSVDGSNGPSGSVDR